MEMVSSCLDSVMTEHCTLSPSSLEWPFYHWTDAVYVLYMAKS